MNGLWGWTRNSENSFGGSRCNAKRQLWWLKKRKKVTRTEDINVWKSGGFSPILWGPNLIQQVLKLVSDLLREPRVGVSQGLWPREGQKKSFWTVFQKNIFSLRLFPAFLLTRQCPRFQSSQILFIFLNYILGSFIYDINCKLKSTQKLVLC